MSTSRAVRQRQIYIAAGANVVFVLSLFLPWYALGSYDSINGWSALAAPWLILLVALVALAALFAEVYRIVLPLRLDPARGRGIRVDDPTVVYDVGAVGRRRHRSRLGPVYRVRRRARGDGLRGAVWRAVRR